MDIYDHPQNIEIRGKKIAYYRYGKGETILFVHGITTYSFIWKEMIPFFKDDYEIIMIDILGTGDSDKALEENISLKKQAHVLRDFCEHLQLSKIHLVCHDIGGGIGQIFSVNWPNLLSDLTLINSVAYNFWPVQPIITMRTPIIRQLAMASLDLGMFELIVKRGLYYKEKLNKEWMQLFQRPMKTASGRKGFLHLAKCLDNSNLTEIEEELRNLSLPVLIIRAEADVYLSSSIAEKLHSEIPNSQFVKIKDAGHFIQIDVPEKVAEHILNFIKPDDKGFK
ncbi:alpha/beta hydrolase [uncultured Draconibacterium sp.]|uniref:alpha/beta fold hydrolase n=1 Tax=uncultured Draconibacterium sp. TaxID=1573823 RepID=UPI0029C8747C|nr:alpha/beta hydrolase [uncultured Draconibacterium sp.]